jgi:hypothetical protein
MDLWHGYVVMKKPAGLDAAAWVDVCQALRGILGRAQLDRQPARRLHWRFSLDGTEVLLEAVFDPADLDVENLTRLCTYISQALGGSLSPAEVRQAMRGNFIVLSGGLPWSASGNAARAYLSESRSGWETELQP